MLRRELEPIFFPAPPATQGHLDVLLGEDQDVIRAVDRLFELGLANERVVRAAFAVSSERVTNSEFKSQSFWNSLREAEALAAKFGNRQ